MHLFVYGSLRRDHTGRHHPLLRDAAFVDRATVSGRLYRVSWHPGLQVDHEDAMVHGEVFLLPENHGDMLTALGLYEGREFVLRPIAAHLASGPAIAASTYVWLGNPEPATFLPDGVFEGPPPHPAE